jgi:nucleoside-diphosphate-sugar epimerase
MEKGVCAITGVNGFLGASVSRRMQASGWTVRGIQRRRNQENEDGADIPCFRLGERLDPAWLADVDVLIHCAYDFGVTSWQEISEINIVGTRYVFEAAKKARVGRIVLVSSMHAFDGCRTMYGKAKRAQEECGLAHGVTVIRPGTIFGDEDGKLVGGAGGTSLRLFETVLRLAPVLPVPHSTHPTIYTSHIGDLCALIEEASLMKKSPDVPICAVNRQAYTLKDFLLRIKRRYHPAGKVAFIPVPWRILHVMVCCLEQLRLKLPLRSEAIQLLFDQNPRPDFAPLEYFKTKMRPFLMPQ